MTLQKFPPWSRIGALLCVGILIFAVADTAKQGKTSPAEQGVRAAPGTSTQETPPIQPISVTAPTFVYHSVRPASEAPPNIDMTYDVTPEQLEAQLKYLHDNDYTAITQRDLADMLGGKRSAPAKPVLLGFDDGRATQMTYAVPLLKKYGMHATFYVFTNAIDHPRYLTWKDLEVLAADGNEIAAHSVFHPYLTKITDAALLRHEILDSKRTLDAKLHQDTTSFAYPFGLVNETVIDEVKAAGYTSARGLRHMTTQTNDIRYDLGGFITPGPLPSFIAVLQGLRDHVDKR